MAPCSRNLVKLIESNDVEGLNSYLSGDVRKSEIDDGLFWAVMHGCHQSLTVLLNHGADVNKVDQFGSSVLHWAVQGNYFQVIDTVLRAGADFRKWWTMEGESLLHWACREGCVYVVITLLELGSDTRLSDSSGRKPLHTACQNGRVGCLKALLQLRPDDVNMRDDNGWTALHYASTSSSPEQRAVIHVLMRRDADPLITTPGGRSALDLAFECRRVRALLEVLSPEQIFTLLLRVDEISDRKQKVEEEVVDTEGQQMFKVRRKYTFLQENFRRISKRSRSNPDEDETRRKISAYSGKVSMSKGRVGSEFRDLYGIWRKIVQNDDVELLAILRDSDRPQDTGRVRNSFEDCQTFSHDLLCELFNDCFENGLAIYSHVRSRYHDQIKRGDYEIILKSLTRLDTFKTVSVGGCRVMTPLSGSILFITILCGRFRVAELLLRMRQFDILPMILLVTLIIRRWDEKVNFSDQTKCELQKFADRCENLAVDILNQTYIKDNSEGKQTTLNYINTPFQTYSNMSIIDLAAKANCKKFISVPCCQAVLTQLWLGKLHWLPSFWMWVGWFMPFVLPLYFERELKKKNEYLRSHLKKMNSKANKNSFNNDFGDDQNTLFQSYENLNQHSTQTLFKIVAYIFQSPANKFFYYSLVYFMFIIKFSYVTTYRFHYQVSITEAFCFIFVIGFAVEEIRLLLHSIRSEQMPFYFKDYWNILSTLAILITMLGFLIRAACLGKTSEPPVSEASDLTLYIARVVLLVGLMIFYLRLLFVFSLKPNLGPKMRMISAMLTQDLLPMLAIFFIFFISFGVTFQGILYPNGYDLNRPNGTHMEGNVLAERYTVVNSMKNIIRTTFYGMMAAEYNLENRDDPHFNCLPSDKGCVGPIGRDLFVYGFMILYVLIVNIMLVNLLIALYSNTVSQINKESMAHWLADRYNLVQQFKRRSVAPPPLNIICVSIGLIASAVESFKTRHFPHRWKKRTTSRNVWQENVLINYLITQAFALSKRRYILGCQMDESRREEMFHKVNQIDENLRQMKTKLDEMCEQISNLTSGDMRIDRRRLRQSVIETVRE